MAESFIGLTMLVTLNNPPGVQITGRIWSVIAGHCLTLRDVYIPGNTTVVTEITILAKDIQDLVEAPKENVRPVVLPETVQKESPAKRLEDPAILSVGRPPKTKVTSATPRDTANLSEDVRRASAATIRAMTQDALPIRPVVNPSKDLPSMMDEKLEPGSEADPHPVTSRKGRSRRKGRPSSRPKPAENSKEGDDIISKATPLSETGRGKGWRQTPLLEPNPSFQPFTTLKRRQGGKVNDNGWATEDATDVQDMGDFDFESNLSKFDKGALFAGLRAEDLTADEDRLVGHNRIAKPGTLGGKNLHPTENVLDGRNGNEAWASEADDSEDAVENLRSSQIDTGSGRNSRRAESKIRKSLSRKGMAPGNDVTQAQVPLVPSHQKPDQIQDKYAFSTIGKNRRCEVVSALQMLNLENIADSEFGLTEDMMSENAGRGIAEAVMSLLDTSTPLSSQIIVVLAGNNKSGLRAVAAGRHLHTHGSNVVICVLGLENELLIGLRRQLKVFRSFSGKVYNKIELLDHVKNLGHPVSMIIDGLLGLTLSFEELRTGDQAAAYELIEWTNRNTNAEILAIDIPTGIEPSTGVLSIIDGRPLYIHPTVVVAMGAPKRGLLQAMIRGEAGGIMHSDSWKLFVADVGIANQAWRKAGTRMRRGIDFDRSWVVPIRLRKNGE